MRGLSINNNNNNNNSSSSVTATATKSLSTTVSMTRRLLLCLTALLIISSTATVSAAATTATTATTATATTAEQSTTVFQFSASSRPNPNTANNDLNNNNNKANNNIDNNNNNQQQHVQRQRLATTTSVKNCPTIIHESDRDHDGKLSEMEYVDAVNQIAGNEFKNVFLIRFTRLPTELQTIFHSLSTIITTCTCSGNNDNDNDDNACCDGFIDISNNDSVAEACIRIDLALHNDALTTATTGVVSDGKTASDPFLEDEQHLTTSDAIQPKKAKTAAAVQSKQAFATPVNVFNSIVIANTVGFTAADMVPGFIPYDALLIAYDILAEEVTSFFNDTYTSYIINSAALNEIYDTDCPTDADTMQCQSIFTKMSVELTNASVSTTELSAQYSADFQTILEFGFLTDSLAFVMDPDPVPLTILNGTVAKRPGVPLTGGAPVTASPVTAAPTMATDGGGSTTTTNNENAVPTNAPRVARSANITNQFFVSNVKVNSNNNNIATLNTAYTLYLEGIYRGTVQVTSSSVDSIETVSCILDGLVDLVTCTQATATHTIALTNDNDKDDTDIISIATATNTTNAGIEQGLLELVLRQSVPNSTIAIQKESTSTTTTTPLIISNSFLIANNQSIFAAFLVKGNTFFDGLSSSYNRLNSILISSASNSNNNVDDDGITFQPFSTTMDDIVDIPCPDGISSSSSETICQRVTATYTVEVANTSTAIEDPFALQRRLATMTNDAMEGGRLQDELDKVDANTPFQIISVPIPTFSPSVAPVTATLSPTPIATTNSNNGTRTELSIVSYIFLSTVATNTSNVTDTVGASYRLLAEAIVAASIANASELTSFNATLLGSEVVSNERVSCSAAANSRSCYFATLAYNISGTAETAQEEFYTAAFTEGTNELLETVLVEFINLTAASPELLLYAVDSVIVNEPLRRKQEFAVGVSLPIDTSLDSSSSLLGELANVVATFGGAVTESLVVKFGSGTVDDIVAIDAPVIAPTTPAPVSEGIPVTMAPVTMAPVTMAPVTMAPVTVAPAGGSTMAPATSAPIGGGSTVAPVTMAPIDSGGGSTMAPVTSAPISGGTIAPAPSAITGGSTVAPATAAPVVVNVTTMAPGTAAPVMAAPVIEGNGLLTPAFFDNSAAPVTAPPVTVAPATVAPVSTTTAATVAPVTAAPATAAPVISVEPSARRMRGLQDAPLNGTGNATTDELEVISFNSTENDTISTNLTESDTVSVNVTTEMDTVNVTTEMDTVNATANDTAYFALYGSYDVLLDPTGNTETILQAVRDGVALAVSSGDLQNAINSISGLSTANLTVFSLNETEYPPPTSAPSGEAPSEAPAPVMVEIETAFILSSSARLSNEELQSSRSRVALGLAFGSVTQGVSIDDSAEYVQGSSNITQIEETACPRNETSEICYLVYASYSVELANSDSNEESTKELYGAATEEAIDNGSLQESLRTVDSESPFIILEGLQPSAITQAPSLAPAFPSEVPSGFPSTSPSSLPTVVASETPSDRPSVVPSNPPSIAPSLQPSSVPSTGAPSSQPSSSLFPSATPSSIPSSIPSTMPSLSITPTIIPTSVPSGSSFPSSTPSSRPSGSQEPSSTPSVPSAVSKLIDEAAKKAAGGGLSGGAVAGTVIGVLLLVIVCIVCGYFGYQHRDEVKEKLPFLKKKEEEDEYSDAYGDALPVNAAKDESNIKGDEYDDGDDKIDAFDDMTDDDADVSDDEGSKPISPRSVDEPPKAKAAGFGLFSLFRGSKKKEEDSEPEIDELEKDLEKQDPLEDAVSNTLDASEASRSFFFDDDDGPQKMELHTDGEDSDPEYSDFGNSPTKSSSPSAAKSNPSTASPKSDDRSASGSESEYESDYTDDQEEPPANFSKVRGSADQRSSDKQKSDDDDASSYSGSEYSSRSGSGSSYYSESESEYSSESDTDKKKGRGRK